MMQARAHATTVSGPRRRCVVVLALTAALAPRVAAQKTPSDPTASVLAVEKQWNDARARADVATLERILLDGWTVTHANGTTDTKTTYLRDLESGARTFAGDVTERDVTVRFYGDTAIVAGSSESTVTLNGQAQGGSLHFTRVYVKVAGAWKMAVTQATTRTR